MSGVLTAGYVSPSSDHLFSFLLIRHGGVQPGLEIVDQLRTYMEGFLTGLSNLSRGTTSP